MDKCSDFYDNILDVCKGLLNSNVRSDHVDVSDVCTDPHDQKTPTHGYGKLIVPRVVAMIFYSWFCAQLFGGILLLQSVSPPSASNPKIFEMTRKELGKFTVPQQH